MTLDHPTWCVAAEPVDTDHISATLHAAEPDDILDIRLRLSQPENASDLTIVELEFVDDGEITTHLLPLSQARVLADAMGRLLP